jgi:hypothetical protein
VALIDFNLARAFEQEPILDDSHDFNTSSNNDLVWDLGQFKQREMAQEFILRFENRLCVYSGYVEQIYTNYNIFFPKEENHKVVILPNPFAHHDIFNHIPQEAVKPTGLAIVPDGSAPGKMLLRIPLRNGAESYRLAPLSSGLEFINHRRPVDMPLLPMLVKGSFQEIEGNTPCLFLHSININKLTDLSPLEIAGIKAAVLDKMELL